MLGKLLLLLRNEGILVDGDVFCAWIPFDEVGIPDLVGFGEAVVWFVLREVKLVVLFGSEFFLFVD